MQDRGVQVGDADAAFDRLVADVVGGAVDVAGLEAAAGQQQAEGVAVVVAAAAVLRDRQRPNSPVHSTIVLSSRPRGLQIA